MRRRQSCLLDPKETVLDNYTELFWMQLSFRLLIYLGAQILIIADNKYMYNLLSAVISLGGSTPPLAPHVSHVQFTTRKLEFNIRLAFAGLNTS